MFRYLIPYERHARAVVDGVQRAPAAFVAVVVLAAWWPSAPLVEALPALGQVVHQATWAFGVIWVVWSVLLQAVLIASDGKVAASISWSSVLERGIVLGALLVLERRYGVEIAEAIDFIRAHPADTLAVGASGMLLFLAARLVRDARPAVATYGESRSAAGYAVAPKVATLRSPMEVYRTAVHEAGHLLLYAGRGELPVGLRANVAKSVAPSDLYRGHVTHHAAAPEVRTEGYMWWQMMLTLAGTEAEALVFSERADGAVGDCRQWLGVATDYLLSGFGEVFYDEVEREAQREHNRAVLNALKSACVAELRQILLENRDLLEELAGALVEYETMELDALRPYLDRVVVNMAPALPPRRRPHLPVAIDERGTCTLH